LLVRNIGFGHATLSLQILAFVRLQHRLDISDDLLLCGLFIVEDVL